MLNYARRNVVVGVVKMHASNSLRLNDPNGLLS